MQMLLKFVAGFSVSFFSLHFLRFVYEKLFHFLIFYFLARQRNQNKLNNKLININKSKNKHNEAKTCIFICPPRCMQRYMPDTCLLISQIHVAQSLIRVGYSYG